MKIERRAYTPNGIRTVQYELSQKELRAAYEQQQHIYDLEDIDIELDCNSEYYNEKFQINENPVTESEMEDMACKLREMLNKDVDMMWSYAKREAVCEVLFKRSDL